MIYVNYYILCIAYKYAHAINTLISKASTIKDIYQTITVSYNNKRYISESL